MKYHDPIGAMNGALNGTTLCVAAKCELWVKPADGDSFAVHSIIDKTEPDWPVYCIYVTDYRGKRYGFETLSRESKEQLCDYAIGELF